MEKSQKPVPNPVAVLREEFDDWAVLFNPDTARAVGINPVGVAVWKSLDGKKGVDDIIAAVRSQFSEVPDTVEKEVADYIAELTKDGFIGYEWSE